MSRKELNIAEHNTQSEVLSTSHGSVEVASFGTGYPVLALHGCPGGYDQGLVAGHSLADEGFHVIAPSRPGYLRTPLASGRTPREQADLMAALLDELHLDNVIVMGISAGGPTALELALRYQDRISGLIMVSTITESFDKPFLDTGNPVLNRIMSTDLVLGLRNVGIQLALRYWPEEVLDDLLSDESTMTPEQRKEHSEYVLERPKQREILNETVRTVSSLRARKIGLKNDEKVQTKLPTYPFEEITCPIRAIHGNFDREVPLSHAKNLASSAPQAELVTLDASHLVWLGPDSSRFETAIRTFAHEVAPAP